MRNPPSGDVEVLSADESNTDLLQENDYSLSGSDVNMYYKGGSNYQVTLSDGNNPVSGANISLTLNGVDYVKTTDSSGKVSLPIDLNPDTYIISVSYGNASLKIRLKCCR